eukprot:5308311-Pyramimonas_sp.AAC.1
MHAGPPSAAPSRQAQPAAACAVGCCPGGSSFCRPARSSSPGGCGKRRGPPWRSLEGSSATLRSDGIHLVAGRISLARQIAHHFST